MERFVLIVHFSVPYDSSWDTYHPVEASSKEEIYVKFIDWWNNEDSKEMYGVRRYNLNYAEQDEIEILSIDEWFKRGY